MISTTKGTSLRALIYEIAKIKKFKKKLRKFSGGGYL